MLSVKFKPHDASQQTSSQKRVLNGEKIQMAQLVNGKQSFGLLTN